MGGFFCLRSYRKGDLAALAVRPTMVQLEEDESGITVQRRATEYVPRRSWQTSLIGRPLQTADAPHQTIRKLVGLAVFASDALSSTAYATQEMMVILAAAGTMAFGYVFPLSVAIAVLLAIVTLSYEQVIHAYPNGGGAYIVARDNLGELPAQVAGAALLTDYILTAAVSISAAMASIASAFPALLPYRAELAVVALVFVMVINLRGVRESGAAFAIPSYFFIFAMFTMVGVGLLRYFTGTLGQVVNPPPMEYGETALTITPFLLLHAFSSGTSALTGVEAISNGTTAFREPRSRNAGITLLWMGGILATLFMSISFLAPHVGAVPSHDETVISQIARTAFDGQGLPYLAIIGATAVILVLATNTSFAGFPRLSALLAADGFLPRQLAFRGSRLVYSRGIVALTFIASLLVIGFDANVTALIPLYAIGVFLSFTLSQAGMTRRWLKVGRMKPGEVLAERGSAVRYERGWQLKLVANAFGAACTAVVALVFAITKFSDGAWIVLVLIPVLVWFFSNIHRHYRNLARSLSLENFGEPPTPPRHRVILPVSGVHQGTMAALRYAQQLSPDVTAVHVSIDPEETEKNQKKWEVWGEGVRLVILESPYRLLMEPLLEYIEEIAAERQPNETITVVVPRFVPKRWIENALHTQTATWLQLALLGKPGIVITDVPYQVE
jgi:amino acid transporter